MVIIKRRVRAMTLDRPFSTFQELVHVSWRELADSTALGENKKLISERRIGSATVVFDTMFQHSAQHFAQQFYSRKGAGYLAEIKKGKLAGREGGKDTAKSVRI